MDFQDATRSDQRAFLHINEQGRRRHDLTFHRTDSYTRVFNQSSQLENQQPCEPINKMLAVTSSRCTPDLPRHGRHPETPHRDSICLAVLRSIATVDTHDSTAREEANFPTLPTSNEVKNTVCSLNEPLDVHNENFKEVKRAHLENVGSFCGPPQRGLGLCKHEHCIKLTDE